ncbi:hypothetical protein EQV77_14335 [Halobacillus fulvus]|nr:hypothetical protein EQV77_14335 [Halobacillus fulvus]
MLYIWHIERIIEEILEKHSLPITYEANNQLSAPMSFNVSNNTLSFNYLEVNGFLSKIKGNESKEDIVKIIICHEIGYYLTFQKHRHDLRTLMYGEDEEVAELQEIIETNAWDYGRALVPEELVSSYDDVRDLNRQLVKGL